MDERPIFLVGFMGSGKTSVGRELAAKLKREFINLDDVIVDREGKSINQIFEERGEGYFRQIESDLLREVAPSKNVVIALGGGCFVSEENRRIVKQHGRSIWLDCLLEVIIDRLTGDASRPLYQNPKQMLRLLESRVSSYRQADMTVKVTYDKTPGDLADEIIRALQSSTLDVRSSTSSNA